MRLVGGLIVADAHTICQLIEETYGYYFDVVGYIKPKLSSSGFVEVAVDGQLSERSQLDSWLRRDPSNLKIDRLFQNLLDDLCDRGKLKRGGYLLKCRTLTFNLAEALQYIDDGGYIVRSPYNEVFFGKDGFDITAYDKTDSKQLGTVGGTAERYSEFFYDPFQKNFQDYNPLNRPYKCH